GPTALGWHRWSDCERKHAYGLVERFIRDLVEGGYLDGKAFNSLVQFSFWMLGGAGLAVAEAPPPDKARVRDEWGYLIGKAMNSLRIR
ncbi:MAG: TetR/AcrR family transcriptional regulator, partial [Actinobacteria bacterium]|nr:TetR/AcrR family transcriptional regulator [Actinomycetota bacterium]